jgi:Lon protease-like protein
MTRPIDLPDIIPLFPLSGALLLPRGRLPLHIFEPRYLAMVEDVMKTSGRLIGMIQPLDEETLHGVGCVGRLTEFSETEDGRYMITLTGISRFRLEETVEGFTPYLRGRVEWEEFSRDLGNAETAPDFDREPFLSQLGRYLEAHELSTDWTSLGDAEDESLINALAMLLPFQPEERQALLEAETLSDRGAILETLIEFALHGGRPEDQMQ